LVRALFCERLSDHYARLNQGVRLPRWSDCYSGNMSVPRQTLLAAGGFAVDLPANFDLELGYRLQQRGAAIVYLPAAQGEHDDYKDYRRLLNDDEREGRILPELTRRHPALLSEYLSTFWDTSPRAVRLRKFFLALRIQPHRLARLKPPSRYKHRTRNGSFLGLTLSGTCSRTDGSRNMAAYDVSHTDLDVSRFWVAWRKVESVRHPRTALCATDGMVETQELSSAEFE
jgi:hypothetical protein